MKIKTNDKVKVTSGKDAGKSGKIVQVFPKEEKVVVEGLNIMKKNLKSGKGGEKGQTVELAAPLHVSKVSLICPSCNLETRVGYKIEGKTKKRICRKCKAIIE